jgi:Pvc16 N-terminal domain
MIDRFDEALRVFLLQELGINDNEVDIVFDQPKRAWSGRLSKPTINLYLHDMRENSTLRAQHPLLNFQVQGNEAHMRRQPINVNLHYLITAWATKPEDEHRLLLETLVALLRFGGLPEKLRREYVSELEEGISFKVAQQDMQINPRDIWSVLDNEMRPAIDLQATLSINPLFKDTRPIVREIEIVYHHLKGT